MKKKKFTFKTTKPTGRYRSFDSPYHEIKFKGLTIGTIDNSHPHKIRLQFMKSPEDIANKDNNANCSWKWGTLVQNSESLQDAKNYLNTNIDLIFEKYNLNLN